MEMLGKCNFDEAISASNEALKFNQDTEIAFVSITIKVKAHELLGQNIEADAAYLDLIKFNNINNKEQAIQATSKLNPLIQQCTQSS